MSNFLPVNSSLEAMPPTPVVHILMRDFDEHGDWHTELAPIAWNGHLRAAVVVEPGSLLERIVRRTGRQPQPQRIGSSFASGFDKLTPCEYLRRSRVRQPIARRPRAARRRRSTSVRRVATKAASASDGGSSSDGPPPAPVARAVAGGGR